MKKTIFLFFVVLLSAAPYGMARNIKDKPEKPFYVALQGGATYSISENTFSYNENGSGGKLINGIGSLSFGYDFSYKFGIRLNCSYAKNPGACNTAESGGGFYPYTFKSVNVFADAILNLSGKVGVFSPKLYAGIGVGNSFDFTDSGHPWQNVSSPNTAFGFRFGFIPQWDLSDRWSIFADLCGEAYTDSYNGLNPSSEDRDAAKGYSGFPLDLRAVLSAGVMIRF